MLGIMMHSTSFHSVERLARPHPVDVSDSQIELLEMELSDMDGRLLPDVTL
jgi:hypothetical protein